MERGDMLHEVCPDNIDRLALQALVDALFKETDAGAFEILNKMLMEEKNE